MFCLEDVNTLNEILIYKNKIYLMKKNELTLERFENEVRNIKFDTNKKIIESKVEYSNLPSISKIFYIMVFNLNRIPTVNELTESYIYAYFIENKDYTFSEKISYNKTLKKYSYLGLSNRVYNNYEKLIVNFHIYLMFKESKKLERVIYSLNNDIYNGIILNIKLQDNDYRISINNFDNIKIEKKFNYELYEVCKEFRINPNKEKVGAFNLLNKRIVMQVEGILLQL